jgi:uncharacterized cofD-like protein
MQRIRQADMIVIGPGNLYCSLLPNLIIRDFARAIRESRATVVYVANLTNKRGHTEGFCVDDYVRSIENYIGKGRIDYAIANVARPPRALVEKYESEEGKGILVRIGSDRRDRSYRIVCANVVSRKVPDVNAHDVAAALRSFIRHDPDRLARAVMFLLEAKENRKVIRETC